MQSSGKSILLGLAVVMVATMGWAQDSPAGTPQISRRPPWNAQAPPPTQPQYNFFSIMDGGPKALELHHDTQVGTNKPVDVYMLAIELQVMNSDGDFEPEGLIIDHFYTAQAVQPNKAPNPRNARDCGFWYQLVQAAAQNRNPLLRTWPYIEFTVAEGARIIQTNEDGAVYWSDDIECWGSSDRFPPF
jgi:hypothetical protein